MFISQQEYDVLEAPIQQTFTGCEENSAATLFVRQRDVGIFFFLSLGKKYAVVRCNLTGRVIKKRKWNEQTKTAAKELLAQHKVSKTGWYIFWSLIFAVLFFLFYVIYTEVKSTNNYNTAFNSKTDSEQHILLSKLGKGDLIKTSDFVYKIVTIDKSKITVLKGNVVKKPFDPIDENQTFSATPITIDANAFWEQQTVSTTGEYNGELIFHILNK